MARVGQGIQQVREGGQVGEFFGRAGQHDVLAVAHEGVDRGRWHANAAPVHDRLA